ncbi:hypothetical protein LDK12_03505 [Fusobacterium pseudoperiodonticum]|uniref:hypothetical protein n=1 Tax=Fusobacterium pseudoperiodonticum TaxID=2663009 RepID=UPI0030D60B62
MSKKKIIKDTVNYIVKLENFNHISEEEKIEDDAEKKLNYLLNLYVNETNYEREKKQSLETRASWIITLLGVIMTILLQSRKIRDLLTNPSKILKFFFFISLLLIILIFYNSFVIIATKKHLAIDLENLKGQTFLENRKIKNISIVINSYRKLCKKYRNLNEKKSKNLNRALKLTFFLLILLLFFEIII